MDELVLGPGAWDALPPEERRRLLGNAPTFLDDVRDPDVLTVDLAALAGFRRPALLTLGEQGAPFFPPIVAALAAALPRAETRVFAGAGHLPQESHPAEYAAAVAAFAEAADAAGPG
jgi:pimeloyl-ACP methyl ester carboxylesterase